MSLLALSRPIHSSSVLSPQADGLGHPAWTVQLEQTAHRIYDALGRQSIDLAPIGVLAHALGISESALRAAIEHAPHLGLCVTGGEPMVFCLPPEPLAAGFLAEHAAGRLMLRLPERGRRPALLLSGHRVGPVPVTDRAETVGAGELAHLVSRLTLMARNWLPPATVSPTRLLFELIAVGWRKVVAPERRIADELAVYSVDFGYPVARGPEGPTQRLELVTHYRDGIDQLVNVYPALGVR